MTFQPFSFYLGCLIGFLLISLSSLAIVIFLLGHAAPDPDGPSQEEMAAAQRIVERMRSRANGRSHRLTDAQIEDLVRTGKWRRP
jgi:hypothetical protein